VGRFLITIGARLGHRFLFPRVVPYPRGAALGSSPVGMRYQTGSGTPEKTAQFLDETKSA
jgi:hypothetical protein